MKYSGHLELRKVKVYLICSLVQVFLLSKAFSKKKKNLVSQQPVSIFLTNVPISVPNSDCHSIMDQDTKVFTKHYCRCENQ